MGCGCMVVEGGSLTWIMTQLRVRVNLAHKHILKPLLKNVLKEGSSKENIQDLTKEDDDLSDEDMLEFECE